VHERNASPLARRQIDGAELTGRAKAVRHAVPETEPPELREAGISHYGDSLTRRRVDLDEMITAAESNAAFEPLDGHVGLVAGDEKDLPRRCPIWTGGVGIEVADDLLRAGHRIDAHVLCRIVTDEDFLLWIQNADRKERQRVRIRSVRNHRAMGRQLVDRDEP